MNWNAYLAPFSFNIWNAIGLTIIVVGLTIAGIDAFSIKTDSLPANIKPKTKSSLPEILFSVFGVFCGQGELATGYGI